MASSNFLWIEEGAEVEGPVAEVAPALPIDRTYTFAVPQELAANVRLGQRVQIPLRKSGSLAVGFVVRLDRGRWDSTLRPIHSVVDESSFLTPELIDLGRQISGHYCCPLGITLKAMTPQAVRDRRGLVRVRHVRINPEALAAATRLSKKQKIVIDFLTAQREPVEFASLATQTAVSSAVLRTMIKKSLLEVTVSELPAASSGSDLAVPTIEPSFALNPDQQNALDETLRAVQENLFRVLVLFGVSGSGKTEVYIRAIREVVKSGRQAILLVPEIVLTTQLSNRLAARFPNVAIQHSGLSESHRASLWRQIAFGEKTVVVGTRSAVFAPCPNLGLIIVDEEQESSYKNLQAPRFHVRDVAIMRARHLGIPIVLGSATPSLETWHRANTRPDYQLLQMPRRVMDLPMPRVHVIDMRDEIVEQKKPVLLSRSLERLLGETLARGEQALILINRRGFAHRAFCPECKSRLTCPNCSSSLVVHASTGLSLCHYCRTRMATPTHCPQVGCGGTLIHVGTGTQKIEQLLGQRFPKARIQRVDSDTVHRREQYEKLIADFEQRRVDVLVGTQMIAKGLDFPHVSFVGMIHTESEGFSADFRAHERLFQLVTQVAGRAGRATAAGEVVIQTVMPELPALRFALTHDYPAFAAHELSMRARVGFPPFRRLARFIVAHTRDEQARQESEILAARIRPVLETVSGNQADLLGPTPAPIPRLRKQYRYDLLLRTVTASELRKVLDQLRGDRALRVQSAQLTIDVDPVSLA
jgi:primosomal protein N' (replication factor Y) (superfamily II helicase)